MDPPSYSTTLVYDSTGKSVPSPNDLNTMSVDTSSSVRKDNRGPTGRFSRPLTKDTKNICRGRPSVVSGRYRSMEANRRRVLLVRNSA